jgi:hypothetical protein
LLVVVVVEKVMAVAVAVLVEFFNIQLMRLHLVQLIQ